MNNNIRKQVPGTISHLLALAIVFGASQPALADGGVLLGVTTVLDSGDPAAKIDIVFLPDGYTAEQQEDFNAKVDLVVAELLAAHPIFALRSAFNIHRVNVSSPESGTDKFATCGGDSSGDADQLRRTALDAGYCSGGNGTVYRCMFTNDAMLATGFANSAPDDNFIVVLVNDTGHGGCASGSLAFTTVKQDFEEVAVHEFGHSIFDLADEYQYDREDTFTGGEPGRVNVTISQNPAALKWGDLVLASTSIPSQLHGSACSNEALPARSLAEDIVGTFEGAQYSRCGIFRPQYFCRMRESHRSFCGVCRRQVIRTLLRAASPDRAVVFSDLLIRDDSDPWPRGDGEIYTHYDITARGHVFSGRWPGSGESDFDDDQTKTLNVVAGIIPLAAPGIPSTLNFRVRESDWPDGDDDLSSDATIDLPDVGAYSIDRTDYRLQGDVRAADLRILLDVLHVKDDQESFPAGDGDIYVLYTVTSGDTTMSGRWPQSGTVGMSDNSTRDMAVLAAVVPRPPAGAVLSVSLTVRDEDGWFTGGDDDVGAETLTFDGASAFGTSNVVHVRDSGGFRVTLSVAGL